LNNLLAEPVNSALEATGGMWLQNAWATKGLAVHDFRGSVDLSLYPPHTQARPGVSTKES
jgi:hypothetical protein